jgi:hypothetical protein
LEKDGNWSKMGLEMSMERDRTQRYAESLERTIQNNYHYLKETIDDFQDMCRMVTPERNVPQGTVVDIREIYKEIQNRLKEIKAVEQLLHGKYRQYYHRDSLRDREIMEIGFVAKNCYSKVEHTLMQKQAQEKAEVREREQAFQIDQKSFFFQWFRSEENQVTLLRNLRILNELDYERLSDLEGQERREVIQNRLRSLTLFVLSGEKEFIDEFQSQIRLREHDSIERYDRNELRGVLTHLREINPSELEKIFKRLMETKGFSKLKCLLLPIHSQKDLKEEIPDLMKTTLQKMTEGEVKTLLI